MTSYDDSIDVMTINRLPSNYYLEHFVDGCNKTRWIEAMTSLMGHLLDWDGKSPTTNIRMTFVDHNRAGQGQGPITFAYLTLGFASILLVISDTTSWRHRSFRRREFGDVIKIDVLWPLQYQIRTRRPVEVDYLPWTSWLGLQLVQRWAATYVESYHRLSSNVIAFLWKWNDVTGCRWLVSMTHCFPLVVSLSFVDFFLKNRFCKVLKHPEE